MQDNWKLKKKTKNIEPGQGLFTLTKMEKQHGKLPAMYNCVKCVCICVIVSCMVGF